MESKNNKYGSILKQWRIENGFTVLEVAMKYGHTRSWLSDIESGRRRLYFEDALNLCFLYGHKISELSLLSK